MELFSDIVRSRLEQLSVIVQFVIWLFHVMLRFLEKKSFSHCDLRMFHLKMVVTIALMWWAMFDAIVDFSVLVLLSSVDGSEQVFGPSTLIETWHMSIIMSKTVIVNNGNALVLWFEDIWCLVLTSCKWRRENGYGLFCNGDLDFLQYLVNYYIWMQTVTIVTFDAHFIKSL